MTREIHILRAAAAVADDDGNIPAAALLPDRRSRKVGLLPDKARLVLQTAQACLTALPASLADDDRNRLGVSLGTLFGSMDQAQTCLEAVAQGGFSAITPSWYATGLPNATAAIVASVHDLRGPNLTTLGWSAGLDAIVHACRQLRAGRADGMLAGGFDWPTDRFAALYRGSETSRLYAGAALLWLAPACEGTQPLARVLGWSQADADAPDELLVDAALRGRPTRHAVQLHTLAPWAPVDHLAASAPLRLVQLLTGTADSHPADPSAAANASRFAAPGVHALITREPARMAHCLVIDKPE